MLKFLVDREAEAHKAVIVMLWRGLEKFSQSSAVTVLGAVSWQGELVKAAVACKLKARTR